VLLVGKVMRVVQSGNVLAIAMTTFSVTPRSTRLDYCNALSRKRVTVMISIIVDVTTDVTVSTNKHFTTQKDERRPTSATKFHHHHPRVSTDVFQVNLGQTLPLPSVILIFLHLL